MIWSITWTVIQSGKILWKLWTFIMDCNITFSFCYSTIMGYAQKVVFFEEKKAYYEI